MKKTESIVLGGGCFWCIEAVFGRVAGVVSVTSGYSGGSETTSNYEQVSLGTSGHAEVVEVVFDPSVISLEIVLEIFFRAHNPTTLNQQGADVGTQYRSVIFYSSEDQLPIIKQMIERVQNEKWYSGEVITDVLKLEKFFPAEKYHQNYYNQNSTAPYCQIVIAPKLEKLSKYFTH